jgi:two-component system sensor kinase FixL
VDGLTVLVSLALLVSAGVGLTWFYQRARKSDIDRHTPGTLAAGRAEWLNAIINTTVDGIIVINTRSEIEAFNRGAERLFGYPASEVMGRKVSLLMPSPHHEEHDGYLQRYLATGDARIIGIGRQVNGRRRDGSVFPLHLSVGEMVVGDERKFTGVLHDLTARVQLEEQLRASEARWRAVIDSAVDGIIVIDAHGRIESFNPAAERLFGYAEADVLSRNVDMLMPSPYREEHDTYLSRYLATGRPKIIGIGREVTGLHKHGTTFPLHLSVGQITIEGERKFVGILHDLSVRVRIEEQLREQTALARLGEMAAVVAHEVKNPLAGIRGTVQVIGGRMPPESRDAAMMKEIVSRIDSLDAMMKDMLLFARPPKPSRSATDLVPIVKSTANLLQQDPSLRDIDVEVAGSAAPIVADADMLKIVFQNLFVNSAQAMQGRGGIHVAVAVVDGTYQVEFRDSGPGIPPAIRDKIFTPFFTTKSRGTGLGLATAKRLVEAHGGEISIDCPSSGGTTILIQLPLEVS